MSRLVAQFDPSGGSGGFSAAAVNRCSALLFMNESANFLTLDFGGAFPPMILQPWSNRLVRLAQPVQTVNWTVAATLASADAPVSQVYVEAFDPGEELSGITSGPLFRQTNVGNSVSTSASTPNSLEQDILTPCVISGLAATKDGTLLNQLDVTGGVALLRQSDSSLGRVAPIATTFETTALNATYFLDLQPDGSYSFGLSHSGQPNYLSIAQVTTNASGNIASVTDERTLNTTLLNALTGMLALPQIAGNVVATGYLATFGGPIYFDLQPLNGEGSGGVRFGTTNGAAGAVNLRMINATTGQLQFVTGSPARTAALDQFGNLTLPATLGVAGASSLDGGALKTNGSGALSVVGNQAAAGSFGVPVIVAQAINTQVTATTQQTILSFTPPANGLYRLSASFTRKNTGGASNMSLGYTWTDPNTGGRPSNNFVAPSASYLLLFSASMSATTSVVAMPVVLYASSANTILITFQDASGTPNDNVSAMIERLS